MWSWFPDPWLSVWYLLCWMCACDCEYGGADRTSPLWWVFYSSLFPTVPDMAQSQQCHAAMYGCNGHESLWFGIESAVKKLSVPSVLYAFCPPSVLSPSCQILYIMLSYPPLYAMLFWSCPWLISRHLHMLRLWQRLQWISIQDFFAEARYYATFWSIFFQGQFYEASTIVFYLS